MRFHLITSMRSLSLGVAMTALIVGAGTASAQTGTAAAQPDSAAEPDTALANPAADEEIVVTARFRTESLAEVPIAITALDGDALAEKNLNNLQDISQTVPTVDFRAGASNKDRTVFIRGVGTITTSPGVEPSVSTVVDGVVLTRPGQSTLDLVDVERIEVLRGPQGTLFGKNASAGVINVVSRDPTNDQRGQVQGSIFTDGEYRLRASLSGPLIEDKLLYSITGLVTAFDGNVKNLGTGNDVNGFTRRGGRIKLLATPTDTLRLTFAADYMYSRDDVPIGVIASTDRTAFPSGNVTSNTALIPIFAANGVTPSFRNRTINTTFDSNVRDKNYGGSLQADLELGDFTLTSITAYREWKNHQLQDWDTSVTLSAATPQGVDDGRVKSTQFSQELRLTSPEGGFIDYVLGLYYLAAKTDEIYTRTVTRLVSGAPVTNTGTSRYGIDSDNYAVFGEANLNFTKDFRAILGARLVRDELSFYETRVSDAPPGGSPGIRPSIGPLSDKTANTDYTLRTGLQYDLGDNIHAYATYSRGYKGPAFNIFFNLQAFDTAPLDPETSNSFEIGLKGSILDRRVNFSLAAYSTKFSGYQSNFQDQINTVPPSTVTRLINAGKVKSEGIEGDFTARPIDNLALAFAFAYNNAKIVRFNCPPAAPAGSCADANGDAFVDGQPLPFAPKWKLHADATYTIPISDSLSVELNTDYSWKSETQYQITQTADTIEPSYGIWNASIALIGQRGAGEWQLRALVRNITNNSYSTFLAGGAAYPALFRFVPRDDKRYFGLSASFDF